VSAMKIATRAIILGTIAFWIAWDVIAAKYAGETESMIILSWAQQSIVLPHFLGFLCGHWFMPRTNLWRSGWMLVLPVWVLLAVWDVLYHFYPSHWQVIARYPVFWVLIGIACGSYLWGQSSDSSPIP